MTMNILNKASIWQEFCYDLISAKERDVKEEEYQKLIENGLRQLGWSKAKGEICPKERLEVGSNGQLEPDITLKLGKRPVLVIEVKRPSNKIKERQEIQLLSYMRMRNTLIGIYIGEEIRLYYDYNSLENEPPYMAWRTEIDEDATEGNRFVDFFHRDTFNANRLIAYCEKSFEDNKTNKIMSNFQNALRVDQNKAMHEVLTEYFVNYKKCNPSLVQSMLETMQFTTSSLNKQSSTDKAFKTELHSFGLVTIKGGNGKGKDTTKYALDGKSEMFGKGKFVREIVARFVENNPTLTYNQLKQIFPDKMQGSYGVLRSLDELENSTHDKKDLLFRYAMEEDKQLISSDGVRFVVCTQWGIYNFGNILDLLKRWGWSIIQSGK